MTYPNKIRIGHNGYKSYTKEEISVLENMIEKYGLDKHENN